MTASDWVLDRTYRSASGEVRWAVFGGSDAPDAPDAADAPPVVLLHGTPFSSYVWRDVARALAQRRRVYVWDMPGYGASEKAADQDVSLAAQGRVFGELLDHWGLAATGAEPDVVAHDFGGCVALRAHLLHGARYRRLALVDPVALPPFGSAAYQLFGGNAEVFERLPAALHRALVREYVGSASGPGLRPDVWERLVEPWCGEAGQPAFYRQIAQNDQRFIDEVEGRYGEVSVPVLVCWGTEDAWIPVAHAGALAARIPGAGVRLIEGAGHLVPVDAGAELCAALCGFLGWG